MSCSFSILYTVSCNRLMSLPRGHCCYRDKNTTCSYGKACHLSKLSYVHICVAFGVVESLVNFQIDTLISRPSALADVLLATANAKHCPCPSASAQSETPLNGPKKIRPKRTRMQYLRERTAGDPMRAFRGWTPGLRACRAPVQQRPTAPNIVKMAEGGKRQRNWWLYNE